jgi:PAS domain S-box-containing protein
MKKVQAFNPWDFAQQFSAVVDRSALVVATDAEGTIVFVNDLFVSTSKYAREELLGQNYRILKSGKHPKEFYERMWATLLKGEAWRGEVENKAKDGSFYWVDSTIMPVYGPDKALKNHIAIQFPITALKVAEAERRERNASLEGALKTVEAKAHELEDTKRAMLNVLEDLDEEKRIVEEKVKERTEDLEREKDKLLQVTSNMKGGGILLDASKRVVFVNEAAFNFLKLERPASEASVLPRMFELFKGSAIAEHFERCYAGETFSVPEIEGNGRVYEIFFHALTSDHDATKDFEGYFILFFDITDAKLLERSKSELVAVASHQLRTPLTAMRGNVEMLVDESYGPLNKEQHELLNDIEVSTIRLITMVNDMLDITKIERGNLDMTLERIDAKEIIDSVILDLSEYANRHQFTITFPEPAERPIIKADKVRVRQIFQNLIDNAIKYCVHPGTLDIAAVTKGSHVEISFADNGIGIPLAEQSKLFGRFYRASNTTKASSSGSGLGLYIVKSIAKQLGGDIGFVSEEGKGTTFTVSLPVWSE